MIIKNRKKLYLEQIDREFPKAAQDEQKQQKIALLNQLEEFEKKYEGQHVRADLMQLAKVDSNFFDPSVGKALRKNCLVECSHFIETNWKFATAGKLYILDEEATAKNIAGMEEHKAQIAEKAKMESEVGSEVANTIKAIGQAAKAKVAKTDNQQAAKAKEDITAELTQKIADAKEAGDVEHEKSLQLELDKIIGVKAKKK